MSQGGGIRQRASILAKLEIWLPPCGILGSNPNPGVPSSYQFDVMLAASQQNLFPAF